MVPEDDLRLETENLDLRRLLAQAGIHAAEQQVAERLQRLLFEELHHRVKNTLATVMAITSQSLRTADSLEHGKQAIESRLLALGRVHDLLLQTNWTSAALADIVKAAIAPFDQGGGRFMVQSTNMEVSPGAVLPLAMVLNELCTNASNTARFRIRLGEWRSPPLPMTHKSSSGSNGPSAGAPLFVRPAIEALGHD